jgi:lipopolysaccharide biosynthesis glycosyltransferase
MRQDNIESKLWEFAQKESPLRFQDQDVLNSVFDKKTKFLAAKWNIFAGYYKCNFKDVNAGIVHFTGANKPWIFKYNFNYGYDFIEKWWKYYASTPYFKKKDLNIFKGIESTKWKKFELKIWKFILFSIVKETYDKVRVRIFHKLNRVIKIKPKYRENRL